MYINRHSCAILKKHAFFPIFFFLKNTQNTKFNENLSRGSIVVLCGQTDGWTEMTKLIVAFRDFAKAPT